MKDKFLVKIPLDIDDEAKGCQELRFKTYGEISEYLQVKPCTVRAIVEGEAKFSTGKTRYLKNIKIEKIEPQSREMSPPKTDEETKLYLKNLIEKAKEMTQKINDDNI